MFITVICKLPKAHVTDMWWSRMNFNVIFCMFELKAKATKMEPDISNIIAKRSGSCDRILRRRSV